MIFFFYRKLTVSTATPRKSATFWSLIQKTEAAFISMCCFWKCRVLNANYKNYNLYSRNIVRYFVWIRNKIKKQPKSSTDLQTGCLCKSSDWREITASKRWNSEQICLVVVVAVIDLPVVTCLKLSVADAIVKILAASQKFWNVSISELWDAFEAVHFFVLHLVLVRSVNEAWKDDGLIAENLSTYHKTRFFHEL